MLVRIVQFLIGAALAGGGGYFAWLNRSAAASLFPIDPANTPWMFVGGVAGVAVGAVVMVAALIPRAAAKAEKEAEAARREAAIKAADDFYSQRAHAADRDWRSGSLPPPAPPPQPEPQRSLQGAAQRPAPSPQPAPRAPEPAAAAPARPAAIKPQASSAPPIGTADTAFPATATLAPLPRSNDPPPYAPPARSASPVAPPPQAVAPQAAPPQPAPQPTAPPQAAAPQAAPTQPVPQPAPVAPPQQPVAAAPAPAPRPAPAPSPQPAPPQSAPPKPAAGSPAFDRIRAAIAGNQLDEADRMLAEERDRAGKTNDVAALAELTGLAGDHAAAAGRQSNASWLWRLALKRFEEAKAMQSPAAQAVLQRLKQAGA